MLAQLFSLNFFTVPVAKKELTKRTALEKCTNMDLKMKSMSTLMDVIIADVSLSSSILIPDIRQF
jgi:hypothetical protein